MEKLLGNSKVANSQEIFLMAKDQHTAKKIGDMNDVVGKGVIASRNAQIDSAGEVKHAMLTDIQRDIQAQRYEQARQRRG